MPRLFRRLMVCVLLLIALVAQARRSDPLSQAMALRSQAQVQWRARQREQAIRSTREAHALLKATLTADHPETQATLYELGVYLLSGEPPQQDLEEATRVFQEASAYRRGVVAKATNEYLQALHLRVSIHRQLGQSQELVRDIQSAMQLQKTVTGENSIKMAEILIELADDYERLGDYLLTEQLLQRSLSIAKERVAALDAAAGPRRIRRVHLPDDRIYHRALIGLGVVQYGLERYADAERTLLEAVRYGQEHNTSLWTLTQPYTFLGATAARRGNRQAARAYFTKALECAQQDPVFGQDEFAIGMRYLDIANYPKTEELLLRARKLHADRGQVENSVQAAANYGLAIATAQQGRISDSLGYLQTLLRESEIRIGRERFALNESRLIPFFDYLRDHEESYVYTQLLAHINDPAWQRLALTTVLLRKARLLDELANASPLLSLAEGGASDAESARLFRQLREARSRYSSVVDASRGAEERGAEREKEVRGLVREMERLESELRQRSASYAARQPPAPDDVVARVAAALPADAVLLEYVAVRTNRWGPEGPEAGESRFLALGLRHDGSMAAWDLGAAGPIDAAAAALVDNASQKRPDPDKDRRQTEILTEQVLRPLQSFLTGRATLVVSPDGSLNQVPFAALFLRDGVRLIAEHRLRYVNSGRDLLNPRAVSRALAPPTLFARPDYRAAMVGLSQRSGGRLGWPLASDTWADLPGTEVEQEAIANQLAGTRVFVGAKASEANLLSVRAPVVLHIATHGKYLAPSATSAMSASGADLNIVDLTAGLGPPNPLLRSALILAGAASVRRGPASLAAAAGDNEGSQDGIVTALEAAGMDLWGTKLVVLSACESGRGDAVRGQGVLGLRRAFLLAGAESVVATLWRVDDTQTAYFMRQFYAQLTKGVDRVTALQKAMQKMLNTQGLDQPHLWAPFVLIGQEGPIPFAPPSAEVPSGSR